METVMHTPAEASVVAEGAAFSEPEIATGSEATSQISSVEPEQVVATHSENHTQEIDEAGGVDDMGKNSEGFGFKMIRQSPAGASKSTTKSEPVSKENFEPVPATAEPAAMAAAAAAESAPAAASAPALAPTDPKAIASIVDSVLAELRPKIVEEIAKKLAGDPHKE